MAALPEPSLPDDPQPSKPPDKSLDREPTWQVSDYVASIRNARGPAECFRMLVSDLARRFHESSVEAQRWALKHPPPLTGTKWDSLLAATAEHVATTHDHPIPDWCDDPQRSLRVYWFPLEDYLDGFPGALYRDTPAAFLRHGIIIGNKELGPREGERNYGALFGQ